MYSIIEGGNDKMRLFFDHLFAARICEIIQILNIDYNIKDVKVMLLGNDTVNYIFQFNIGKKKLKPKASNVVRFRFSKLDKLQFTLKENRNEKVTAVFVNVVHPSFAFYRKKELSITYPVKKDYWEMCVASVSALIRACYNFMLQPQEREFDWSVVTIGFIYDTYESYACKKWTLASDNQLLVPINGKQALYELEYPCAASINVDKKTVKETAGSTIYGKPDLLFSQRYFDPIDFNDNSDVGEKFHLLKPVDGPKLGVESSDTAIKNERVNIGRKSKWFHCLPVTVTEVDNLKFTQFVDAQKNCFEQYLKPIDIISNYLCKSLVGLGFNNGSWRKFMQQLFKFSLFSNQYRLLLEDNREISLELLVSERENRKEKLETRLLN